MDQRLRIGIAVAATVAIFALVQLGALALVQPFDTAGFQAVEDPQDPTNSLVYVGAILAATVFMLGAIRFSVERLIRAVIVLTAGVLAWHVLVVVLPVVEVAGMNALPVLGGAALVAALYVHPEWYVIDAAGILMGAGAAGLFGISFGVLPAIVLLSVLAVYDAISVYGTEHMLTLAEGVMDLKIPILFVVPVTLSYSFLDADPPASTHTDDDEDRDPMDRDALFIGLGDAVIPTVLVASAAFFLPLSPVAGLGFNLPALTAMVGTLLGLLVLLRMVLAGRAHAGLPLLNGGAIGGYIFGALASGIPLSQALGIAQYL